MQQRVRGVEGDGLLEEVFHLLWHKTGTTAASEQLAIPDTVVIKYGQPVAWYFTSVDGTIKRKSKVNLTFARIQELFTARPSRSGLVASYIYNDRQSGLIKCVVEHLDAAGLLSLLATAQPSLRRPDGVLQRWVDPAGERNMTIRALWSPKITIAEKVVNTKNLFDRKLGVNERAATFEDERNCQAEPIKGERIISQVDALAKAVVEHIARLTHGRVKISRLALTLKQGNGNLWLLFVTSSRVQDPTPLELRCEFSLAKNSDCPFVCAGCNEPVKFLVGKSEICDDCFLSRNKPHPEIRDEAPFVRGTQPLEPHRLKQRRESTVAAISDKSKASGSACVDDGIGIKIKMRNLSPTRISGQTNPRKNLELLLERYKAAGKISGRDETEQEEAEYPPKGLESLALAYWSVVAGNKKVHELVSPVFQRAVEYEIADCPEEFGNHWARVLVTDVVCERNEVFSLFDQISYQTLSTCLVINEATRVFASAALQHCSQVGLLQKLPYLEPSAEDGEVVGLTNSLLVNSRVKNDKMASQLFHGLKTRSFRLTLDALISSMAIRADTVQFSLANLLTAADRVFAFWNETQNAELYTRAKEYIYGRLGHMLSERFARVHRQFTSGVSDHAVEEIVSLGSYVGITMALAPSPFRHQLRSLALQIVYMQITQTDAMPNFNVLCTALVRLERQSALLTRSTLRQLALNDSAASAELSFGANLSDVDLLLTDLVL